MRSIPPWTFSLTLALLGAAGCGNLTEMGPSSVAYTPDGNLVAFLIGETRVFAGDSGDTIRSVATPAQEDGWTPFASRFALSGDGGTFAVGAMRDVTVYDVDTGALLATIPVDEDPDDTYNSIAGIAISRTGDMIAAAVRPIVSGAQRLAVWRVADRSVVLDLQHDPTRDPASWGTGLSFSADGAVLYGAEVGFATGDQGGSVRMDPPRVVAWSTADGHRLWESPTPQWRPEVLALSPDGTYLATAGVGIELWRAADGTKVETFQSPPQESNAVAVTFSPDGSQLVTTYWTNQVKADALVFGLDGALTHALLPVEGSACEGVAFSPDGACVAAACGNYVKFWNPTTGALLGRRKVTAGLY